MKAKNGEMTGRGRKTFGEKGKVTVSSLPQILKEERKIVYQALGGLAREDKIEFHNKEGETFVSLSSEEREIFKKSL